MPVLGNIDNKYPEKLQQIGLTLLEPFTGAKKHHLLLCNTCSYQWTATPISKLQTNKKYGVSGCPNCNTNKKNNTYTKHRQQVIQDLFDRGIEILDTDYDGRLRLDYSNSLKDEKIKVRNVNCGHIFMVTPLNLIQSNVNCPICARVVKTININNWSKSNSEEWKKTADDWQRYKSKVRAYTRISYKANKDNINPNNLPTGKAGTEGAYHLDHIVPIRYCFENYIPAFICGQPNNLQMLGWRENVGSKGKLKDYIPEIFKDYIKQEN